MSAAAHPPIRCAPPVARRTAPTGAAANRPCEAGFTLLETLVALTVLATGAVGLLTVLESHTRRVAGLEDRIAMRWVAENALAARALGLPADPAWETALGVRYAVERRDRVLADGLVAQDVTVSDPDAAGTGPSVVLRGYALSPEATP